MNASLRAFVPASLRPYALATGALTTCEVQVGTLPRLSIYDCEPCLALNCLWTIQHKNLDVRESWRFSQRLELVWRRAHRPADADDAVCLQSLETGFEYPYNSPTFVLRGRLVLEGWRHIEPAMHSLGFGDARWMWSESKSVLPTAIGVESLVFSLPLLSCSAHEVQEYLVANRRLINRFRSLGFAIDSTVQDLFVSEAFVDYDLRKP